MYVCPNVILGVMVASEGQIRGHMQIQSILRFCLYFFILTYADSYTASDVAGY